MNTFPRSARRLALAAALASAALPASLGAASAPADGDQLMVVDCLLPGQVRKLGTMSTFMTPRRPIKTTARDCEIRGGEYTSYDRASYATALQIWLPQAKDGDPEAQNNVGEIYEKGLGLEPDYQAAAVWYRRAAEQGYTRAQINLGHLYEKGLGVERDPTQALQWYRRASGLEGAVVLDPGTLNDQQREIEALREEVAEQRREAEQLRRQLEDARRELEDAREELRTRTSELDRERESIARARSELERRRAAESGADEAELARAERELAERESKVARQQAEIDALRARIAREEADSERYREQLAELDNVRAEVERERTRADSLDAQLESARRELEAARSRLAERSGALESARAQVEAARADLAAAREQDQSRVAEAEAALAERERALAEREREIAELERRIAQARTESERYRERLEREQEVEAAMQQAALAGPSIEIIDPPLVTTRGAPVIRLRGNVAQRTIVGRISAPAGLMTLVVNDQPVEANAQGVFQSEVPVTSVETPVTVAAVDKQGKRSSIDFMLHAEARSVQETKLAVEPPVSETIPRVNFGGYHALVIGNNDYQHLPKLDSAVRDATAIGEVLDERYGFEVTLLTDATRYDILAALNELRKTLNKNDNLLIYYAGHGELDEVNMRGHWLPVDAEADSTANWISNVAITDMLNVIAAKHVLVVADSCYSGALTRSALTQLDTGMTEKERLNWVKTMVRKRARTALTSGGLKPVLDAGGGAHSVFARALIEVLEGNEGVLEGQRLYREVSARVAYAASTIRFEQVPEYAPIKHAGHEAGDFFLVPKS